jgi:D-alanine-D-alanine ligase
VAVPRSLVKLYEFEANYSEGGSNYVLPHPDLPFVYQEVRRLTLAAHVALGCRGVSCCGFPLSATASREQASSAMRPRPEKPGKTETSQVPELASVCGHNFDELVQWMVQDASLDRGDRRGPKLT